MEGVRLRACRSRSCSARAVVDHGAHVVIDHDQLVDAAAAAIAIVRRVSRPVQGRRGGIGLQVQQPPLVVAGLERLPVVRD